MTNTRRSNRPGTARVIGTPGRSTMARYRHMVTLYRQIPFKWLAAAFTLTLGVIGAATYSVGGNPLDAFAITGGILIATDIASRFPSVAATITVVAASSVLSTPFATIYAVAADGGQADEYGAVATVTATLIVAGILAHRTSRGRPWLTVLITAVTIMFVGPFLLLLNPVLGFAWAWLITAAILFLRGGGLAWMVDQWEDLAAVVYRRRAQDDQLPAAIRDLEVKNAAQIATAAILADLPEGYVIFHDRQLNSGVTIDHLIIGPTGVHAVQSEKFKGRITEDAQHGLIHNTVAVGDLLNDTDTIAALTRRHIRLRGVHVTPVLVIHDAVLPTNRARVALSADGSALGTVTITTPAALVQALTMPPVAYTDRQVRRITARVARASSPANSRSLPAKRVATVPAQATLLDADGHPKTTQNASAAPLFPSSQSNTSLTPGQQVTLLTDQGTFSGYRITGEARRNGDGVLYVPVTNSMPTNMPGATTTIETWFPLDSVQPADAPQR